MTIKRIGIVMALAWGVTGLVLFNIGVDAKLRTNVGMVINILFLLIVIFLAIRENHREKQKPVFIDDVKAGMKQGAIYIMIVSAFVYIQYRWIEPEFLNDHIETRIEAEEDRIEKQGGWEAFSSNTQNGNIDDKSKEDYLDDVRENGEMFISPGAFFLLSLISLISIGFIYSLLITVLNRKVLSKFE